MAEPRPIAEVAAGDAATLDRRLREGAEGDGAPFVVRGLAAGWPLVAAGRVSASAARDHIAAHARDGQFDVLVGTTEAAGRMFYTDDLQLNFGRMRAALPTIFAKIEELEKEGDPRALYLGSVDLKGQFDGLHEANQIDLGDRRARASIWIGTRTRIAAHNDSPDNLAVVAVGRRRFTLFPRDQVANLYLGPLDHTPAGRPVSMVDLDAPDFDRFPRFSDALAVAQTAELGPGDAIFIPSLWWHHIAALDAFNVLVNYWWDETPAWAGSPEHAMYHAMLALRALPDARRDYWRRMFDLYVFGDPDAAAGHIPPHARGMLGPMTAAIAQRLRAVLRNAVSR